MSICESGRHAAKRIFERRIGLWRLFGTALGDDECLSESKGHLSPASIEEGCVRGVRPEEAQALVQAVAAAPAHGELSACALRWPSLAEVAESESSLLQNTWQFVWIAAIRFLISEEYVARDGPRSSHYGLRREWEESAPAPGPPITWSDLLRVALAPAVTLRDIRLLDRRPIVGPKLSVAQANELVACSAQPSIRGLRARALRDRNSHVEPEALETVSAAARTALQELIAGQSAFGLERVVEAGMEASPLALDQHWAEIEAVHTERAARYEWLFFQLMLFTRWRYP